MLAFSKVRRINSILSKMPNDYKLSTIVVSKFKSFCKYCTLHGVYYFYKASSWSVYFIWTVIIAAGMALCCFLGHMIWEKFVIDPTLTVVETTHYSVVNIPFPAVTICDTEKVFLPKTQEITDLLLLRGYNMSEIQEFYKSLTDISLRGYTPEPRVKKIHSLLDDIGYPLKTLLDMFKRPCSDMIIECNWRSRPHNCSEMFRTISTAAGHCCRFDIPYFRQHTNKNTNFIAGMEADEALDIIVNGQKKTIDGDSSNGYTSLYVYDNKDKVTIIDNYITLTPDSYFDVNVYFWAIDSSSNVKSLALSSRKCILETDQGVDAGFYQGCMARLILRRVVNHCRCLPFDYTYKELDVEDYSICSWDRLICIYQTIEMVQVDIKDIISHSECYQRCDYVQYDTEVEFIKNTRHLRMLNQSRSRVLVHFGHTTCIKYRREVLYTWDQMLANLGGIFGLCLGGSLISVIEIIWFLLELMAAVIGFFFKKPITSRKNQRVKVFVVSEKNMLSKNKSDKKTVGKYKFVN